MWKEKVQVIINENAATRVDGKPASPRTQDVTRDVIFAAMNTLHSIGMKIQDPYNLGHRHLEALVRHWWLVKKLKPKTLQNHLSRLRVFCEWMGKRGLVRKPHEYLPEVDPSEFKVRTAAKQSKSWTTNGVDVEAKIREATALDRKFGMMLRLQLAFGLRRKEVIKCRPWKADRGNNFRVYPDEAKGGRPRDIPIETAEQREALDYVKAHTEKTKALGWEYTESGKRADFKYNLNRYNAMMRKIGITREDAGVTGHGLRAQYAENAAIQQEFVPPTLGGTGGEKEPDELATRRLVISENLGHSRIGVTPSYYGSFPRKRPVAEVEQLRKLFDIAVHALKMKGEIGPIKEGRFQDCIQIVHLMSEMGIDLSPGQSHRLWEVYSERLATPWAALQSGIPQALEVAACAVCVQSQLRGPSLDPA